MSVHRGKCRVLAKLSYELLRTVDEDLENFRFELYAVGLISSMVRDKKEAGEMLSQMEKRLMVDESVWDKIVKVLEKLDKKVLSKKFLEQLSLETGVRNARSREVPVGRALSVQMNSHTAKRRVLGRCCNDLRLAISASLVDLSFNLYSEGLITMKVRDEKKAESIVSTVKSRLDVDESSWDKLIQVLKDCDFQPLAEKLAKRLRVELGEAVASGDNDLVREETAQLRHKTEKCSQLPSEDMTQFLMKKMMKQMDQHDQQVKELMASLEAVTKKHNEDKAKLVEALVKLETVEKSFQEDEKKIAVVEAKLAAVEKTNREDHEKHSHQIYEQKRENALLQDEKRKLVKKVDEFEGQLQQHSAYLLSLVPANGTVWLMDARGTLSSPYPPCQIVMPQFSQHKRDGDEWYSQPFYSAPGGYKLSLRVDAKGASSGAGTHVSVSISLMKGDNDSKLNWPFVHDVTYGILNWKRVEHHFFHTADFKNAHNDCNRRVTSKERAKHALGVELLPHSLLCGDATKEIQYLYEDCLCLQVLKVEPPK